jgi:hypothetical protein
MAKDSPGPTGSSNRRPVRPGRPGAADRRLPGPTTTYQRALALARRAGDRLAGPPGTQNWPDLSTGVATNEPSTIRSESACLSSLPAGNHTMRTLRIVLSKRAANRTSTVELPTSAEDLPGHCNGKDHTPKPPAAAARRRGHQTSTRRTPDIGTGAGRHGVIPRLSFRLIHSCSQRFTGGRRPGTRAARDARGRRRTVVRSTRKRVRGQPLRGFKSHLHRH